MMKVKRHRALSFIISLLLLGGALSLLFINQWFGESYNKTVEVRQVHLVSLPPPPPPAEQQEQVESVLDMQLAIEGSGPAIEMTLNSKLDPLAKQPPARPTFNASTDWQTDLSVDWQAFGLDELDGLPTLLTQAKSVYPNSLVRKGIEQLVVKLDVFIDEQGALTLVAITGTHYPELDSVIKKLIRQSRFSSPIKNGQPVRARFIWPVEFKKS